MSFLKVRKTFVE